jgi:multidrug efflux system membrane fusion protein
VTANATTPLVTIDQVQPIYVNFTVPEQYLDEVRKNLQKGTLNVEASIEGKKKNAVSGAVSFLQNTVDTTTGTVQLRAAFANTDLKLYPGQFVDVVVSMPPDGKTVVVPSKALQTTQAGTAVYIVKSDDTVIFSPVDVARTFGDLAALSKGVAVGDTVVTDGQLQLTPTSKVQIVKDASGGDEGESVLPGASQ